MHVIQIAARENDSHPIHKIYFICKLCSYNRSLVSLKNLTRYIVKSNLCCSSDTWLCIVLLGASVSIFGLARYQLFRAPHNSIQKKVRYRYCNIRIPTSKCVIHLWNTRSEEIVYSTIIICNVLCLQNSLLAGWYTCK